MVTAYRLRRGKHEQKNSSGDVVKFAARDRRGRRRFGLSDIVPSNTDLVELFGAQKFERMHNNRNTEDECKDSFDKFTVVDLKQLLKEDGIEFPATAKKAELIELLRNPSDPDEGE